MGQDGVKMGQVGGKRGSGVIVHPGELVLCLQVGPGVAKDLTELSRVDDGGPDLRDETAGFLADPPTQISAATV